MGQDNQTVSVYDAQATKYMRLVESEGVNTNLTAFLELLPKGAHILDLGCGPGHCAAHMRDHGFSVLATDASPEMITIAKETYDLEARVATFADLSAVDTFDGVWASFSLLHAPKAEMPNHLAAIYRALRTGGVLCISLKVGDGQDRDAIGRFYSYYTDAEITGLLQDAGFAIKTRATGEGTGLDGRLWPWIVITCNA